jgi:S-DNA-T family DNA segregation ATPase FtsK/SpoIIIE
MKNLDKILRGLSEEDKRKIAEAETKKKEDLKKKNKIQENNLRIEELRAEIAQNDIEIAELKELINSLPDDEDMEDEAGVQIIKEEKDQEKTEAEINSDIEDKIADIKTRKQEELDDAIINHAVKVGGASFPTEEVNKINTKYEAELSKLLKPVEQNQEIPKEILDLFDDYGPSPEIDRAELEENKDKIIKALKNKNIEITNIRAIIGDIHTLYEISLQPGEKLEKITDVEDELILDMKELNPRFHIDFESTYELEIEIPNKKQNKVSFKEVLEKSKGEASDFLPGTTIRLGKEVDNEILVLNLTKLPHLLVAGMTGQGKNEIINTALSSLILDAKPSELKLVLMDYQKVEFYPFSELHPNYIAMKNKEGGNIISDTSEVIENLNNLCIEMDDRYDLLKKYKCKNWKEYNEKIEKGEIQGEKKLNMIVLAVNEIANYIMTAGKEVELPLARLAQLARAIGIHVIIGTYRPSENILTGVIRANFPARISTKVSSKIDSKIILDKEGGEDLGGKGDMIFAFESNSVRLAGGFIKDDELEKLIEYKNQELEKLGLNEIEEDKKYPKSEEVTESKETIKLSDLDEKFEDVARLIVEAQHGSTSLIQRKMQFGYNRAGRIMDQLEQLGIVGPAQGSKPREVLFYSVNELEEFLKNIKHK